MPESVLMELSSEYCVCTRSVASNPLKPPGTVARQASLSMEFSRREYWSGLPCPHPGDLPDPEIKPVSLMSPALADRFFTTSSTWLCTQGPYIHTLRKADECLLNHSYFPTKKNVIIFPVYLRKVQIAPAHPGCPPLP